MKNIGKDPKSANKFTYKLDKRFGDIESNLFILKMFCHFSHEKIQILGSEHKQI